MSDDDDVRRLHRAGDPDTSVEAAELVLDKIRFLQRIVLRFLIAAGSRGLADWELEELCGNHGSTYRTRRSELVDKGFVINSGRRRLINGRNRIVWIAALHSVHRRFTTDHLKRIQYNAPFYPKAQHAQQQENHT